MAKVKPIKLTEIEKKVNNPNNWIYWLLGVLTFVVFANTIGNDYNMDDELVTRNHPLTSQGIKAIGEIFSSPYYKDDMGYAYGYRPIVHVSYAIEHELFAENPQVSHFVNVILYVFSVLLFFRLLHRLFGEKYLPLVFISALFFAIHPVHTEVVASLKNRDELLGFLFAMASGNWLVRYIQKSKSNWLELILAVLFFLLALLSKKSVYPLVFVFPLALSLFTTVSWRTFFLVLVALVLQAALVTSELDLNRFLILSIVPITFGTLSFYILGLLKEKSLKSLVVELTQNKYFLIGSIILILVLTTYLKTQWLTFIAIPFFFLLIRLHRILGVVIFSLSCLLLNFLFSQAEYDLLAVIFPAFLMFQQFKERALNRNLFLFNVLVLAIAITLETYQGGFNYGVFARYFVLYIFLFIRNYKSWLAIVFVPSAISVTHFVFGAFENGNVNFYAVSLVIIAANDVLATIKKTEFNNKLLIVLCVAGFSIPLVTHYQYLHIEIKNNSAETAKLNQTDIQNQGEGRALDYVENTLIAHHSTQETVATGFSTLGEYFRLLVFPSELSFYYGFAKMKTEDLSNWQVWLSIIIHFGLIILALWKIKDRPIISFGIFWYFVSILLFSNWVELVAGMVGERLAFTASAGFSIFLAGVIYWLKPDFNLKKPSLLEFSLIVILILFSIRTISRNSDWQDAVTLMSRDIKHLQNSAQANNLLALNLAKFADEQQDENVRRMNFIKAKKHFKRAFTIYSNFPNAYFDYARVSMILGENQDAIFGLKKSIQYNPTFNQPYLMLCEYYDMQKDATNMRETANKWLKNTPEELAYIALCKSYILKGDKMTAKKVLIKGQTNYPNGTQIASLIKDFDSIFKD